MASPNARTNLLASETYSTVLIGLRQAWIDLIESLSKDGERLGGDEVFKDEEYYLRHLNA
jgi:hypothetical protein